MTKHILLKTNLHCQSCIDKLKPLLLLIENIDNIYFNLSHPDKLVKIEGSNLTIDKIIQTFKEQGYQAELMNNSINIEFKSLPTEEKFWGK